MQGDEYKCWLVEKGVQGLELIDIVQFEGGDRGIRAAQDIPEGHTVKIPPSLHITCHWVLEHCPYAKGMELRSSEDDATRFTEDEPLIVFLLHERRRGRASEWAPWLQTMPETFPHTIFWADEELCELQGSFVRSGTELKKDCLKARFEVVRPYLHEKDSLEDFLWAHCAIESRSYDVSTEKVGERTSMMAPLSDLFNHDPYAIICYGTDLEDSRGDFEYRFTRATVKKGEQIFINYGLYGNRKLIQQYGFASRANPDESVKFSLNLSPAMPDYEKKCALLRHHNLVAGELLSRRGSEQKGYDIPQEAIDPHLMVALRIQCLSSEDPDADDFTKQISVRNEAEATHMLITLLCAMLERYSTALEEDIALAEDLQANNKDVVGECSMPLMCALALRIGEKEVVQDNMEYLQGYLDHCMQAWEEEQANGPKHHAAPRQNRSRRGKKKKKNP